VKRVFNFELGGKQVLGFDTGLDAQAFAQAKMAQFITQTGAIVYPGGKVEPWQAAGVIEIPDESGKGIMVVQGPGFPGESLDSLLRDPGRREDAFDAVRFWLNARLSVEAPDAFFPGAAGILIVMEGEKSWPRGTLLFPPERLIKRCIEAEGDRESLAAQQWYHPDLRGEERTAFSAGIMLYAVFSGGPPFVRDDGDTVRQDMREGVFMPPELAVPGLDAETAALINEALLPVKKIDEGKKRPSPSAIAAHIGNAGGFTAASLIKDLPRAELAKIENEREQYKKTRGLVVKTRRFVIRNTAIITGCTAAFVALVLGVWSYVKHIQDLPNTVGMTPVQVAETYYGAFGTLDHTQMEACVINKAGKGDVDMVVNLYVISRMRQAYESMDAAVSAQAWLDAGAPATSQTVFGVTGLNLTDVETDESDGEVRIRADYTLWMPATMAGEGDSLPPADEGMDEDPAPLPPASFRYSDELKVTLHKDAWRISEINRNLIPD
jgi:hypothetical protein